MNDCPDLKAGDSVSKAAREAREYDQQGLRRQGQAAGRRRRRRRLHDREIGFPTSCTDVTFPGFVTPCGGPVGDLQSLTSCVACVTRFKAGCADRAGATGLTPYPSECNP